MSEAAAPAPVVAEEPTQPSGILLFAGSASHSMTGRSQAPAGWDGVPEQNLWSMHRFGGDMAAQRFKKVISGPTSAHFVLIAEDDSLFVFGRNEKGQLGLGHTRNVYTPVRVGDLKVKTAACGRNHTMIVTLDGKVMGCGENLKGQCGTGRLEDSVTKFTASPVFGVTAVAVSCGAEFSMMLDSNGKVYSCGSEEMGQCGTGQTGERLLKANQVSFGTVTTLQRIRALESQTIAQIACGANHTMAMTADGNVYTWGFGAYGRLGQKDNKDILIPKIVETFQPERMRVALIAAGNSVSYFVQKLGNMLYMAGITKKSSEANMTPKPFYDLQGWVPRQIASGSTCTAVLAGTDLITWGPSPTYGELAYGELTKSSTRAKLVDDLHEVTVLSLACGAFATLCIVDPSSAVHVQKLQALKVYEPPAEPAAPAADSKKRAAPEAEKAGKKTKAAAKK